MPDLKARAEQYLKGRISPTEFERAEPYARRKLNLINSRYGTDHGDEYLAILVSEIVQTDRFSDYLEVLYFQREVERQGENHICQRCGKCGQKEKAASTAANSLHTHIIPQGSRQSQYGGGFL